MLVVFARMSTPHSAVLGHVEGTTSYRNVERFPEARTIEGVRIVRIDAALSFVNAANMKKLILANAEAVAGERPALVLDASGINDLDVTGAEMLDELLPELDERGVVLHLTDVKGPVRDVLRRAGLWDRLGDRIHASPHDAVAAITRRSAPADQRRSGIDERSGNGTSPGAVGPGPPPPRRHLLPATTMETR
jgi:SulP family sulfate permease